MGDRTKTKIYETRPSAGRDSFPIKDGVTVAPGTLVQIDPAAGSLDHWSGAGTFAGIVIGGVDRAGDGVLTGETDDSPDPHAYVDTSGVVLMHVAVASGDAGGVGDPVFCADSDAANLTVVDTTNPPIGFVLRFRTASDMDVQLFSMAEWSIGDAADGTKWDS